MISSLPIEEALPELMAALAKHHAAVLVAPPGAGKTTFVPLALLDAPWLDGRRILMQEPRRIAARAAARRMASLRGETVGETVGYRVRFDSRVGPRTRIEVMTDGLFLRRLQEDAELAGVGCVIFDELHERGLETDLALALCREAQTALRPDLRLIVMSATLDAAPIAALLGDAPIVRSEGRAYPVETRYLDREARGPLEDTVVQTIQRAVDEEDGSLLVFLPGVAEIRRVQRRLEDSALPASVDVTPLFGDLPAEDQDRAIRPSPPGRRKIVLATSLAESSLTIEDVRIVVDGGQMRRPSFSPRTGMSRLETLRVSLASADQRRGRAGRVAPGICFRLWTQEEQRGLQPFSAPEITEADLAPLALELAAWGARDATSLAWLTPPPAPALAQARDLLRDLGAIDANEAATTHGHAMLRVGLHPRLAHLWLRGRELAGSRLAAVVASLLSERDIVRRMPGDIIDPDLRWRVDSVLAAIDRTGREDRRIDRIALRTVLELVRRLDRDHRNAAHAAPEDRSSIGALVALAYPERVGQRRGAPHRFRLRNGRGAILPETVSVSSDFIAVADFDAAAADGRIYRFAEIARGDLEALFADSIETVEAIEWNSAEEAVRAARQRRLGALLLDTARLTAPSPAQVEAAMIAGIRAMGLACLPWNDEAERLRQRIAFLRLNAGPSWPDMSDANLLATLEDWLAPWLAGISRRSHLERLDLTAALRSRLRWQQASDLDRLAPTHIVVPSGTQARIDYGDAASPVLAVRMQEVFGLAQTPTILDGRLPLTLHLLSPARRPVQVTRDLASFWRNGYSSVRGELRGRYPKHFWPDDPVAAPPTARLRPKHRDG